MKKGKRRRVLTWLGLTASTLAMTLVTTNFREVVPTAHADAGTATSSSTTYDTSGIALDSMGFKSTSDDTLYYMGNSSHAVFMTHATLVDGKLIATEQSQYIDVYNTGENLSGATFTLSDSDSGATFYTGEFQQFNINGTNYWGFGLPSDVVQTVVSHQAEGSGMSLIAIQDGSKKTDDNGVIQMKNDGGSITATLPTVSSEEGTDDASAGLVGQTVKLVDDQQKTVGTVTLTADDVAVTNDGAGAGTYTYQLTPKGQQAVQAAVDKLNESSTYYSLTTPSTGTVSVTKKDTTPTTGDEGTDAGTTGDTSTEPTTGGTTSDPGTTGSTSTDPTTGGTTSDPGTTGGTSTDPTTGGTTSDPGTAGGTSTDPTTGGTTSDPGTTGGTSTEPTTGGTTSDPGTTGGTSTDPTTGGTTSDPGTTGGTSTDPTTGGTTSDPGTTGSTSTDPTTGGTTSDPGTTGGTSTEPTTGGTTSDPGTTGGTSTDPTTGGTTSGPGTTGDTSTDPTTGGTTSGPGTTGGTSTDPTTGGTTSDPGTTGGTSTDPTTGGTTSDPGTTGGTSTDPTTGGTTSDPGTTGGTSTDPTTGGTTSNPGTTGGTSSGPTTGTLSQSPNNSATMGSITAPASGTIVQSVVNSGGTSTNSLTTALLEKLIQQQTMPENLPSVSNSPTNHVVDVTQLRTTQKRLETSEQLDSEVVRQNQKAQQQHAQSFVKTSSSLTNGTSSKQKTLNTTGTHQGRMTIAADTSAMTQLKMATVVYVDASTGMILTTEVFTGTTGTTIDFDTAQMIAPFQKQGYVVTKDDTRLANGSAFVSNNHVYQVVLKRTMPANASQHSATTTAQARRRYLDAHETAQNKPATPLTRVATSHRTTKRSDSSQHSATQQPALMDDTDKILNGAVADIGGAMTTSTELADFWISLSGKINLGYSAEREL